MAELTQRDTNARSIRNARAYTEHADFPNKVIIDVRNRLNHLVVAWNRFNEGHTALVRAAQQNNLQAEVDEHNRVFDEIETAYFDAAAALETRLRAEAPANDEEDEESEAESEHSVQSVHSSLQGNDNDADDNQRNRHNRRLDRHNDSGSESDGDGGRQRPHGRHQHAQAHQQNLQAMQPRIYVQCGNNRRENYWGEFDGTLTKWRAFYDGFKAAIHDDDSILPVFKFQHLKNSLRGKALAAFSEWELTADNYAEAWEQLKEMYHLKYQTSQELVCKFLNLTKIDHPTHENIERLSTVTNGVLRQLRALHYPVHHYDLFIVHCLHQRLDSSLSKDWEIERDSDTPTAAQMLAFLNRQAKSRKSAHATETRKRPSNYKHEYDAKRSRPSTSREHKPTQRVDTRKCKVCNGEHAVHKCPQFAKMSLTDRKKSVREHELCYNCLYPSHASKDCRSSNCKRCNKKHNSLLCSENPFNRAVHVVQQHKEQKSVQKRNKWFKKQQ